ncbi:flippase [Glaciimonas soli]|uniref:Oligosaccharide flippase family protein n=1 Tax=Glaciimonas soli TaxID=2590999 RepID=A0A843YXP7_9BURK|nr:flippase [Glaciimonas soli]MQR01326.1 oligosaccharide flippase family protein [Glaciimonas soli]
MSLKRNTVWNLVGSGLPFLLGVITIPYLIKHIGVEAFGILTLVWALIGYFSLFDFGLGRALTQKVASCLVSDDQGRVPELVKSGLIFTAITGILGGFILAIFASPLGHSWLKVSESLQADTVRCLLIAAFGIPLTTVTTGLRGVLEAYEDFKDINLLRVLLGAANFGLPALSVMLLGPSLAWMVVSLVAARLIVTFAHIALVNKKLSNNWWQKKASAKDIKGLLSFGVWMTVSNIISPLMVTADRFVISAVLGASAVAYYTVPSEVLMRVLIIPAALSGALFPRLASKLMVDSAEAKKVYYNSMKVVAGILAPICLIIALGSYWGLSIWLGKDFAQKSWAIVSIMSVGILFNGIAFIPFAAIQATGNAQITARLHALELLIYIPLLYFFLHTFGILGAAIVWTIRVGGDLVCLLVMAKKTLNKLT